MVGGIKIVKFIALPPHGATGVVKYAKKAIFKNHLYSHTCKEKMHGYNVHEAIYLNYELIAPGPGVQALEWGQYGHIEIKHSENLFLFSHIYLRKKYMTITQWTFLPK